MMSISIHPREAIVKNIHYPGIGSQAVTISTKGPWDAIISELTIWAPSQEVAAELESVLKKIFPQPQPVTTDPETDPDFEDIF